MAHKIRTTDGEIIEITAPCIFDLCDSVGGEFDNIISEQFPGWVYHFINAFYEQVGSLQNLISMRPKSMMEITDFEDSFIFALGYSQYINVFIAIADRLCLDLMLKSLHHAKQLFFANRTGLECVLMEIGVNKHSIPPPENWPKIILEGPIRVIRTHRFNPPCMRGDIPLMGPVVYWAYWIPILPGAYLPTQQLPPISQLCDGPC